MAQKMIMDPPYHFQSNPWRWIFGSFWTFCLVSEQCATELRRSAAQHGGGAATNATAAAVSFFHAYKLDYCTNKLLYTVYNLGLWNWVNFCLFVYGGLTRQWSFLNFGRLRTFIVLIGYKDKLMLNQQTYVFKAVFLAYICGKSTILKMNPYFLFLCLVSSPKVSKLSLYFQKLSGGIFWDYDLVWKEFPSLRRIFFDSQNLRFIIESGFKSRASYNGARTVSETSSMNWLCFRWKRIQYAE